MHPGSDVWHVTRWRRCAEDPAAWVWSSHPVSEEIVERFAGSGCVLGGSLWLFGGVNTREEEGIRLVQILLPPVSSMTEIPDDTLAPAPSDSTEEATQSVAAAPSEDST